MKPHTEKFLQRRRFLMVLPLLTLPFLTMIFWALGGGQGVPAQAAAVSRNELNLELPDARFEKKEIWDKLSLYDLAARDSAKFEEARERDPYFDLISFKTNHEQEPVKTKSENSGKLIDSFPNKDKQTADPNEEKVNRKLEELYREINKPSVRPSELIEERSASVSDPQFTADVDRLEQMMESMGGRTDADPEMEQMEDVLEKILDIQHPERVREKIKEQSIQNKAQVFPVEVVSGEGDISLMTTDLKLKSLIPLDTAADVVRMLQLNARQNAFYGLDDEMRIEQQSPNTIEAVVHDTQELVAGATVKIRLLNDIYINGTLVDKDQFVFGTCAINGERLSIEINSIRSNTSLLPVSLSVYDLDGLEGIYIPGAITRDVAKQSSDEALQNIQLMTLDPSFGAQAASAGLEAAKGLFSKKSKLVKVTVKAGYHILLKDTNTAMQ